MKKLTIQEMDELAAKRGGKCISKIYVGVEIKLEWECSTGHHWWASPHDIKAGSWCPYCSGKAKHTLKEMQKFAKQNNGVCYSSLYINVNAKIKWGCINCENKWEGSYDAISRRKYFCINCKKLNTSYKKLNKNLFK